MLFAKAVDVAKAKNYTGHKHAFAANVESALSSIEDIIRGKVPEEQLRWFAVKLFEQDEKVLETAPALKQVNDQVKTIVDACEAEMDDDLRVHHHQ